jgi:hypothetical protein
MVGIVFYLSRVYPFCTYTALHKLFFLKCFIMETYSFVTPAMFINVIYFARVILTEICLPIDGFFQYL